MWLAHFTKYNLEPKCILGKVRKKFVGKDKFVLNFLRLFDEWFDLTAIVLLNWCLVPDTAFGVIPANKICVPNNFILRAK